MAFERPTPFELIHQGTQTLTQGTTTSVDVGAAQDDELLVATGFESDPGEDIDLTVRVSWDEASDTHEVAFEVSSATANPEITFSVFRVG